MEKQKQTRTFMLCVCCMRRRDFGRQGIETGTAIVYFASAGVGMIDFGWQLTTMDAEPQSSAV